MDILWQVAHNRGLASLETSDLLIRVNITPVITGRNYESRTNQLAKPKLRLIEPLQGITQLRSKLQVSLPSTVTLGISSFRDQYVSRDPTRFMNDMDPVFHQMQDMDHDGTVERFVSKGQVMSVCLNQISYAFFSGLSHHRQGDVDTYHCESCVFEKFGESSRPCSNIENVSTILQRVSHSIENILHHGSRDPGPPSRIIDVRDTIIRHSHANETARPRNQIRDELRFRMTCNLLASFS